MTQAVFWIVSGDRYIVEARQSARTVARQMPDVLRILFTPDRHFIADRREFSAIYALPSRKSEYWYLDCTRYLGIATGLLEREGIEELVYLDSDTWVCNPFPEVYELLERFNLVGAHAPGRKTCNTVNSIPISFPELNVGVLGIRNITETGYFIDAWYKQYEAHVDIYGNNDQGSLRETLWEYSNYTCPTEFSFYVLPPEFNARPIGTGVYVNGPIRILHLRDADMVECSYSCNRTTGARLWKP